MNSLGKLAILALAIDLTSCADDGPFYSGMAFNRPDEVAMADYLNSYGVLKSYVDRSRHPALKLGIGLPANDLTEGTGLNSLVITNADEAVTTSGLSHKDIIGNDGTVGAYAVTDLVAAAKDAGTGIFGHALCGHDINNTAYLYSAIAPIPGTEHPGTAMFFDFEAQPLGSAFRLSGNSGTATVVDDPVGKNGHVLHIKDAAYDSYPVFDISLPEGVTLGDCKTLVLDMKAPGSGGLYGQGMRMRVGVGGDYTPYNSPYGFGCQGDAWGKELIRLDFAALNLSAEQKKLSSFELAVGSKTGKADYYIDNIYIDWSVGEPPYYYTAEEKRDTLTKALDAYLAGVMKAAGGYIRSWDVLDEPMSDDGHYMLRSANNDNKADKDTLTNFYWADYLRDNYARMVVASARKYYKDNGGEGELTLFVSESNLEKNGTEKLNRLVRMIAKWEADGVTKVDGIGAKLHLACSLSAEKQKQNEADISALLSKLKDTGRMIRIAELDIRLEDEHGQQIEAGAITFEQRLKVADYYNYVVRKYLETIPGPQQYGIALSNVTDNARGLWNGLHMRNASYMGVADALAGKGVTDNSIQ